MNIEVVSCAAHDGCPWHWPWFSAFPDWLSPQGFRPRRPGARAQIGLDAGWRFAREDVPGAQAPGFPDASWAGVAVPHTWNNLDGQDGGGDYYRGTGWYRKHFTPPPSLAGKQLWLQFDGVNTVADVWVNGVHLEGVRERRRHRLADDQRRRGRQSEGFRGPHLHLAGHPLAGRERGEGDR